MSFLDLLFKYIPEVSKPREKPPISTRLKWTFLVLLIFFVMGLIPIYGLDSFASSRLGQLQYLLASSLGTIISAGIGPIVVASIILQLLVGSGLLNIDFNDPIQRARFNSWQKLLAIILSFVEAFVYASLGLLLPAPGMLFLVVLQVALGSIMLLYLDELIKNYGIGSGISLFIAAGVSSSIMIRIFNPFTQGAGFSIGKAAINLGAADGLLWSFFNTIGSTGFLISFINNILPILFALLIFAVIVYFEGVQVNIPLTLGHRGSLGRFPVKFFYVSNMPVILAVALFANIHLFANFISSKSIPVLSSVFTFIDKIVFPNRSTVLNILDQLAGGSATASFIFVSLGYALLYVLALTLACVVFGVLWVKMAGQDSEALSKQLQRSGMFLPGFRRDPRVVKAVLDKYIPTVTVLGSIAVGLLAGFADITGAVGSGMGILLTVDIIYRFYEELIKEQAPKLLPFLSKVVHK